MIVDWHGRILALERSDFRGSWQLPQGGLERGETTLDAALREVEEETGIPRRALKLLGRYPELLAYELPRRFQSKKTGLGQVQYWYYFAVRNGAETHLPPEGEFRAAKWVSFERILSGVAPFRKPVYRKLRTYFETLQLPS